MQFNKWMNFAFSGIGTVMALLTSIDLAPLGISTKTQAGIAAAALAWRTFTAGVAPAGAAVTGSSATVTKP